MGRKREAKFDLLFMALKRMISGGERGRGSVIESRRRRGDEEESGVGNGHLN